MADFEENLAKTLKKHFGPDAQLENLVRVTAGASQETWSFDAVTDAKGWTYPSPAATGCARK